MQKFQVSFIGLNTLFGRTSSLLLKQSPFIKCIKLYDDANIDPALDIAGLNAQCKVKAFLGKEQLNTALKDSDIIVIGEDVASENSKMDLFSSMAPKMLDYAKAIAFAAPEAIIVVAASPLNSLLPLTTQMLVYHGCYNCNKVFGATTVDNMRANALLANHLKLDVRKVMLPVIGGSSEETRVPVFSQAKPNTSLSLDVKETIIKGVKRGDLEVKKRKSFPESLNKAYATSNFLNAIMAGLRGETTMSMTLTKTTQVPGVEYFALPVMLGRSGVVRRFGIPRLSPLEQDMVTKAIQSMRKDVEKATQYWKAKNVEVKTPVEYNDVPNLDTKPQRFFNTHSIDDGFFTKESLINIIEKLQAKLNPLDRLLLAKNCIDDHNCNLTQNQIRSHPENKHKEEDISENKQELDQKQETIFIVQPEKKVIIKEEAKEPKETKEKEQKPEKEKNKKFESLVQKTESIISEEDNFILGNKKQKEKSKPKTTNETSKMLPEFKFKIKNDSGDKPFVKKLLEKYSPDSQKTKVAEQNKEVEIARREKFQALKLKRIAERKAMNEEKANFFSSLKSHKFSTKVSEKIKKVEEKPQNPKPPFIPKSQKPVTKKVDLKNEKTSKEKVETKKVDSKVEKSPKEKIETKKVEKSPKEKIETKKVDKSPKEKVETKKVDTKNEKSLKEKVETRKVDSKIEKSSKIETKKLNLKEKSIKLNEKETPKETKKVEKINEKLEKQLIKTEPVEKIPEVEKPKKLETKPEIIGKVSFDMSEIEKPLKAYLAELDYEKIGEKEEKDFSKNETQKSKNSEKAPKPRQTLERKLSQNKVQKPVKTYFPKSKLLKKEKTLLRVMSDKLAAKESQEKIKEKEKEIVKIKEEVEKEKKAYKNLLQMLPEMRKTCLKQEDLKRKEEKEKELKAIEESHKKVIVIKEETPDIKPEKVESKEQIKIIDKKPKEENKIEQVQIKEEIRPPTVLQYLSKRQQVVIQKPKIVGQKLSQKLKKRFKNENSEKKIISKVNKNHLLYKLQMKKIKKKERKEQFKNLNIEDQKRNEENANLLSMLTDSYYGLKKEEKEYSKSYKNVLKEKSRVPFSIKVRDSSKVRKKKKKSERSLLEVLTSPERKEESAIKLEDIRPMTPPECVIVMAKRDSVQIPRSLHTGTCADVVKTYKTGFKDPNEFGWKASSFAKELPDLKFNEYTCKKNSFPSLKFLKEHR